MFCQAHKSVAYIFKNLHRLSTFRNRVIAYEHLDFWLLLYMLKTWQYQVGTETTGQGLNLIQAGLFSLLQCLLVLLHLTHTTLLCCLPSSTEICFLSPEFTVTSSRICFVPYKVTAIHHKKLQKILERILMLTIIFNKFQNVIYEKLPNSYKYY